MQYQELFHIHESILIFRSKSHFAIGFLGIGK